MGLPEKVNAYIIVSLRREEGADSFTGRVRRKFPKAWIPDASEIDRDAEPPAVLRTADAFFLYTLYLENSTQARIDLYMHESRKQEAVITEIIKEAARTCLDPFGGLPKSLAGRRLRSNILDATVYVLGPSGSVVRGRLTTVRSALASKLPELALLLVASLAIFYTTVWMQFNIPMIENFAISFSAATMTALVSALGEVLKHWAERRSKKIKYTWGGET